jgi:hypothetical protein
MSQGQMVAGAGGVLLIIALFLHWVSGVSAWDGFSAMHIIMLLIGLAAVAWAVLPATGSATTMPPSAPGVLLGLGVAVFGFALGFEFEIGGGIGVWLAIVASAVIAYGAYAHGRRGVAPAAAPSSTPAPPPPAAPAA